MKHPHRAETLAALRNMQTQVQIAEAFLLDGKNISALRTLLGAASLGQQASASLVGDCLRQQMNKAASPEVGKREKGLQGFVRLANFVFLALCQSCRQKVSRRLKEE